MGRMDYEAEAFARGAQVALERRKVEAALVVTREASLRVDPDSIMGNLVARLQSYVLAERLVGDTTTVTGSLPFPSSPWQFFKQRHAESWWLRWLVERRPVRVEQHPYGRAVTFERYATFPESTLRVPELGRQVIFEQFSHD